VVPYSTWLVAGSSVVQVMVADASPILEADILEMEGGVLPDLLQAMPVTSRDTISQIVSSRLIDVF
jgi:hypothetical protein